jgi:hypothetical protein
MMKLTLVRTAIGKECPVTSAAEDRFISPCDMQLFKEA